MSESNIITAEIREDVGKGASRRLRRLGKIPAVLYGGGHDSVALTLEHNPILHASEEESFYSSVLQISVADGRNQQVVVRDVHRHPYKPLIMHVDFQRIAADQVLRMSVPLHFVNEEASEAGKASGVVIQHLVTEVEIVALPANLPEYLEVDLLDMEAGGAISLSDIQLPEGVEIPVLAIGDDQDATVANAIHVKATQGEGVIEEVDEDEEGLAEVPTIAETESDEGAGEDGEE